MLLVAVGAGALVAGIAVSVIFLRRQRQKRAAQASTATGVDVAIRHHGLDKSSTTSVDAVQMGMPVEDDWEDRL